MFAEVPLFPEQASDMAVRVDRLFIYLCAVTGAMAVLVTVLILYFAIRYRRRGENDRTPRIEGARALEWFWTITPLFFFISMFVWGASVYMSAYIPPEDAEEVFVVGKQWMWKIQHPGGQREINALHLPVNRPVKLTMTSEDVIHSFYVPAFRTKMDVIPGRYTQVWYHPTKVGKYHLFCAEYCGTSHSNMVGEVIVMEEDDYRAWLGGIKAEGSLSLEGRKLFLKLNCISCHTGTSQARAPLLEELYLKEVTLRGGETVVADDAYLRESILYPERKIVQPYEPIMPTFKGQLTEEQMIQLIAFLRTLGRGQTPTRNEETVPPMGARTRPPEDKDDSSKEPAPTEKKKGSGDKPAAKPERPGSEKKPAGSDKGDKDGKSEKGNKGGSKDNSADEKGKP
jgi:cytochrome c oxidase subunit 2